MFVWHYLTRWYNKDKALLKTVDGCPLIRGTEPSIYIDDFYGRKLSKGGMLVMVTVEILFSFSLVLATVAGGAYALGFTIGKLSSKRK